MAAADWLETAPVPAADVFLAELPQAIISARKTQRIRFSIKAFYIDKMNN